MEEASIFSLLLIRVSLSVCVSSRKEPDANTYAGAETTAAVVGRLIEQLDPPLVFKSDNGSAFVAQEMRALLEKSGILHLRGRCLARLDPIGAEHRIASQVYHNFW